MGSTKQELDYKTTAEYVVNHVKKSFDRGNSNVKSFKKLQVQDMTEWEPMLQTSDANNATIRERQPTK
jgi:hypothetical protein